MEDSHTNKTLRKYGYLTGRRHHWEWSALTNGKYIAQEETQPMNCKPLEHTTNIHGQYHYWRVFIRSIYSIYSAMYIVIHRCTSGVPPWSLENNVDLVHLVSRSSGATCSPKPYKIFEGKSADNWMNWFSNTIPPTELLKLNTEYFTWTYR